MNKKLILVFLLAVIASIVVNVLAGSWISARLATIPLLEKYRLYDPQAPIVISRREELVSGGNGDMQDAIGKAKSRLSAIITVSDNAVVTTGAAINLSSDGYFLTTQQAVKGISIPQSGARIALNNGDQAPITMMWGETGTNLVIVKAALNNVPVTEFAPSRNAAAGQRVGFMHSVPTQSNTVYFQESYITSGQANNSGQVFDSDQPSRGFGVQAAGNLVTGEAVVNADGKVVGIWDGTGIVSSDVINATARSFFENGQKGINRPQWRFAYRNIGGVESGLFQLPVGAQVVSVEPLGAAAKAGLQAGDVITAVGGQGISSETSLEELLQKKPGEAVGFTVVRDKKLMTITITPGA